MPKQDNPKFDPYKVLGIGSGSSLAQIKGAYIRLVLKHHPDKHQQSSEEKINEAETRFKEIQLAYEMLTKNNLNSSTYYPDLEEIGEGAIVPFGEENNPELTFEDTELFISDGSNLPELSEASNPYSMDI